MKFNNIFKTQLLLLASAMFIFSCTQDPVVEKAEENLFNVGGAIVNVSNVQNGFFNLGELESTFVAFDVAGAGETINAITVYKSLNGGAKVEHAVVNTIPSTVNVSLSDAISGLGVTLDDVKVGDNFNFSFESTTSTGTYTTGNSLSVDASCPSELAGTYAAVTTVTSQGAGIGWDDCAGNTWEGNVYFESSASGVYTILTDNPTGDDKWNDPSMGAYYACYGTADAGSLPGGDLLVNELCNTISISGASQWGEIWSFDKVEVNGNELTLTITNDYGEGGITVLTNPNGWPALTN